MSSSGSYEEEKTEVVFVAEVPDSSSEEPPMEEWSSVLLELPEENLKKIKFSQGCYDPGSGEICTQYIAMSASSVLRHVYYNYPAVIDPGIEKALLGPEPPKLYPDDGQDLYLSLCEEMLVSPTNSFYRGLLTDIIDLRYYGVNPKAVRAMAMALKFNRYVTKFILLDNFLSDDACYHLADMLTTNSFMVELDLSGCRIGPNGARILCYGLTINRTLKVLHLDRNEIGDNGMAHLAKAIFQGIDVEKLYLSSNSITGTTATLLSDALETHNKFTVLDFSWNSLYAPGATYTLLIKFSENKVLQELNLAWNSLTGARIGLGIKRILMESTNINKLDLSNNNLGSDAVNHIANGLTKAKNLKTLDLSFNPLKPQDALNLLLKMKIVAVKVQNIILNNVFVDGVFLETLVQVKQMKSRKNFNITYGGVVTTFVPKEIDMRELILNRAEYLCNSKKGKVDFVLLILQLIKDKEWTIVETKDFVYTLRKLVPLDDDLLDGICNLFPGPRTPKGNRTIDFTLVVDYFKRKWPDRKLPPTPPPEPEPEPQKKKGKGKGKKK